MRKLFWLLCTALSARLFYKAWGTSLDFTVYWNATHAWLLSANSPYQYGSGGGGLVYKYPPWTIPYFVPFAVFPLSAAKILWAGLEYACLIYVVKWVMDFGVSKTVAFAVALCFWFIWQAHFWAGQVSLPLLALALWSLKRPLRSSSALLLVLFSAKVFSLVGLAGIWKRYRDPRTLAWCAALVLFPLAGVLGVMRWHGLSGDPILLLRQWVQSAASGDKDLGATIVRGLLNHGFNAGVLRWLKTDLNDRYAEFLAFFGWVAFFSPLWHHFSKKMSESEKTLGWIGVATIAHPLAWDHTFVLVYPLCAVAMSRALDSGRRLAIFFAVLGPVCIGVFLPNIIGNALAHPLEYFSIKSWGVVSSAAGLIIANRANPS
jgi:hypothetical protein